MSLGAILIIILLLMLLGALPGWAHSRNWEYYPSGGVGVVLCAVLVLLLLGRIWMSGGKPALVPPTAAATGAI